MLGQVAELDQKERVIYYLSKKFTSYEINYIAIGKTCCALAWALCKLRQCMLYYTMWLISCMDPIKYIFEKPALTGKISCWQMLLSEFDIVFVIRKAIKGQAIKPELDSVELWHWKFYFDGAANSIKNGVGAVLVCPKG